MLRRAAPFRRLSRTPPKPEARPEVSAQRAAASIDAAPTVPDLNPAPGSASAPANRSIDTQPTVPDLNPARGPASAVGRERGAGSLGAEPAEHTVNGRHGPATAEPHRRDEPENQKAARGRMPKRGRRRVRQSGRIGQAGRARRGAVRLAQLIRLRPLRVGRHAEPNGADGVDDRSAREPADHPAPGPSVPDDAQVLQVLDLAIRVGEVLLSSGEAVAETTAVMLRLADLSGLPSCEVDITFTSITMSCHRGKVALPVTTMRLVQRRSLDLTRLNEVAKLVHRIELGQCDLAQAAAQLEVLTRAKHPYPRWLATVAWSGMAGSIAALYGAGWAAALVAFLATGAIDRIGRVLNRNGLPILFQQIAGALLATGFTAALLFFHVLPATTAPSLVVAAAITVLLSGLSVVGAVRDAIDGFPLTAAGRAAEIALYSAGLLAGVVLALKAANHFGVQLAVAAPLPTSTGSVLLRLAAAGVGSGCFALASYAPWRFLPATFGVGVASWGFYTLFQYLGFGPVASTGIAAVGLGAFAGNLHRYLGVPTLILTVAGVTPLLPGFTAYRGFYELAVAGVTDGLVTIMLALATGMALAGGVALGEWLTSRLRTPPVGLVKP
jgi:uncharacterized membrane protein YjjP (DUF1212 family)